jgi:hypothetical protein
VPKESSNGSRRKQAYVSFQREDHEIPGDHNQVQALADNAATFHEYPKVVKKGID